MVPAPGKMAIQEPTAAQSQTTVLRLRVSAQDEQLSLRTEPWWPIGSREQIEDALAVCFTF
jgi:hypothetical protein